MAMHRNSLRFASSTVAILLLAFLDAPPAAAQPPWQICGDSGDFTQNSTYQSNLALVSTILPRNASSSEALFAAGRTGTAPDIVYALTLCRGDVNASTCAACVAVAFQDAQQLCAYSLEVTIYYDLCYLRFSNRNFLAGADNDEMYLPKVENVSAPTVEFDAAVGALLNATADHAEADSSRRFATGEEASGGSVPAIYALAQCTPDIAPAGCRSCLANVIQMAPKFFSGSPSGRFIGVRCNYRYELYQFFAGTPLLQLPALVRPPEPPPTQVLANLTPPANVAGRKKGRSAKISAAVACSFFLVVIVSACSFFCFKRRKHFKNKNTPAPIISRTTEAPKKIERGKCAIFDLPTLQEATGNFHEKNKIGEGGFGTVYRGKLSDGQKIAVKKLSRISRQGLNQLHNEVQVLAELQHKKLVRLLGFCSHRDEMMLVYEHIKNGSLDKFLFDTSRKEILNLEQKYNIILGIAKGILYLHEDSRIRIIHRDLKANNILLDENMNPKIADFGLARLLGGGHTQTKTASVAGTYGYMAPEYALFGNVSPKIDVFSFGVLVLEIVTERRNSSSDYTDKVVNLLTDVWNNWTKGRALALINQPLDGHSKSKVLRCIHIGLLCVQKHPDDRPNISSVVLMLTRSRIKLQPPRQPAFFFGSDSSSVVELHIHRNCIHERSDVIVEDNVSVNNVTNTDPYPR